MFDLRACQVERTDDRHYRLRWRGARPGQQVAIHMSDDPELYYGDSHPGEPLLKTREEEVVIHNPDPRVRHYFYLESDRGEGVILAERQLSLEGTPNFRDLGGYAAQTGRRMRWGRLYRSGKLSALSGGDVDYVRRLGLTLICDFRQVTEQALEPTRLGEASQAILASLPIAPGSSESFLQQLYRGILEVEDATGFMVQMNRDLVGQHMPKYAEMFRLLLTGDRPLLIHCASGKDRTGLGAALILDVLGVDEEAIVEDYLLTNRYLPIDAEVEKLSRSLVDRSGAPVSEAVLRPLLEVRPEYIRACFEEIGRRYRSREHFYETALALDPEKIQALRDRYLE